MAEHTFEDCRIKIGKMIEDAGAQFLTTATYWKSIVGGFVIILGLTGASIWTGVAWANDIGGTVRVSGVRIAALEASMQQILELREELRASMVAQRQMMEQEQSLIVVLKDRLK